MNKTEDLVLVYPQMLTRTHRTRTDGTKIINKPKSVDNFPNTIDPATYIQLSKRPRDGSSQHSILTPSQNPAHSSIPLSNLKPHTLASLFPRSIYKLSSLWGINRLKAIQPKGVYLLEGILKLLTVRVS
jgi:hypothetical protein